MASDMTPPSDGPNRCVKRRRVATACETCRRRKERCDGQHPCSRCWQRDVAAACWYASHNAAPSQAPGEIRDWPWSPLPRSVGGDLGNAGQSSGHNPLQAAGTGSSTHFRMPTGPGATTGILAGTSVQSATAFQHPLDPPIASGSPSQSAINSMRMIQDPKGRMMFIGDSANLSFLQIIRRIVSERLGSCSFVDDPLRYQMVEASPPEPVRRFQDHHDRSAAAPAPPSLEEAEYLLQRYLLAGSCVLDLYDEADLLPQLQQWSQDGSSHGSVAPLLYLVMAVGAQNSHDDRDWKAAAWFAHGRRLATEYYTDDPSLSTVRAFSLITFYLLNAARRNAAFMSLGTAVRAAYALGLHRREVASTCSESEYEARERLWKVIRILDLFMSASLGRPPATLETRNTEPDGSHRYSTSLDLCVVFEKLLVDVYSARMVSTDTIANIGGHHRRWAARFHLGLETDRVPQHGVSVPNVGMVHVKEAYYWTIMLLTRPFLTESIQLFSENAKSTPSSATHGLHGLQPCAAASSNSVLVYACVNSAIRTVELVAPLMEFADTPKRLPVVINCAFISGLVLGLACFGDLDTVIPLQTHLGSIQKFLAHFSCDPVAVRNASIVGYLEEACAAYVKRRSVERLERQSAAVRSMFGQLQNSRSAPQSRPCTPEHSDGPSTAPTDASLGNGNRAGSSTSGPGHADGRDRGPRRESAFEETADDIDTFDDELALSTAPYPIMNPHTLWFESLDAGTPLFSTYSHALSEML